MSLFLLFLIISSYVFYDFREEHYFIYALLYIIFAVFATHIYFSSLNQDYQNYKEPIIKVRDRMLEN